MPAQRPGQGLSGPQSLLPPHRRASLSLSDPPGGPAHTPARLHPGPLPGWLQLTKSGCTPRPGPEFPWPTAVTGMALPR